MTKNQHSQQNLSIQPLRILLLGTGGTIAGLGGESYQAAQLPIDALIPNSTHQITSEQVAQIDSKDMSFEVWEQLYARVCAAMQDASIDAIVITHGTDTMEETAYFLHATLACTKPVILTGAMRPADSVDADGPRNLRHSFEVARTLANGVWVVFAGQAMPALGVQKVHPQNMEAFMSQGSADAALCNFTLPVARWPHVEVVMNYAGANGMLVDALVAQRVDGIVVAGTGNGTLSDALEAALHKACQADIAVRLTTRCLQGHVIQNIHHAFEITALSPVQARIDLMLRLMQSTYY